MTRRHGGHVPIARIAALAALSAFVVALLGPAGLLDPAGILPRTGILEHTPFVERTALGRVWGGNGVVLRNTAVLAALTGALTTTAAWAAAHSHVHHDLPGRRLAHALCLTPLLLPPPTIALALLALAGGNGLLTRHLGIEPIAYGAPGLVLASTLSAFPYAYLVLLHGIELLDPRVAESAADLGADRRHLARREADALRPSLAIAALLVVSHTVANLADPLVLGGDYVVVATRLFEAATAENDLTEAAAHGVALAGLCLFTALAARHLGGRARPVTHRAPVRRHPPRGRGARAVVGVRVTVAAAVALSLAVVLLGAVGLLDRTGPTTAHLHGVLAGPFRTALADSVLAGILATGISLPLGLALGERLARARSARPERVVVLLGAVPSLVLGLLAWLVLTRTGSSAGHLLPSGASVLERRTWLLLVVVLVLASLPTTATTVADALRRLPTAPTNAALTLGASRSDLRRDVWLPALRGVVGAETATTFARSVATLAPVALLATSRTPLLPVELVTAAESGRLADACAMATTLGVLVGVVAILTAPGPPRPHPAPTETRDPWGVTR